MQLYFLILFSLLTGGTSCNGEKSPTQKIEKEPVIFQDTQKKEECKSLPDVLPTGIDTLKVLKLSNKRYGQQRYSLVMVNTHELDTDGNRMKRINLTINNVEIASLQLPTGETVKNFEAYKIQETSDGFVILTNWGGGNFIYNVNFYSEYKGNSFVFTKVETEMYGPDTNNENLPIERFKKEIPFEKFVLMAYFDGDYDDNIINSAKDK